MRDVYGPAVRRERKRRGWSIPQLAERLTDLGATDLGDRTKLSKIEAQARNLSIEEWLLLAAALEVPPAVLLSPYSVDEGEGKDHDPRPRATIQILAGYAAAAPHMLRGWLEGRFGPGVLWREQSGYTHSEWPTAAARERSNVQRWELAFDLLDQLEAIDDQLANDDLPDSAIDSLEAGRTALLVKLRDLERGMKQDAILPFDLLYDGDADIASDARPDSVTGRAVRLAHAVGMVREAGQKVMEAEVTAAGERAALRLMLEKLAGITPELADELSAEQRAQVGAIEEVLLDDNEDEEQP